MRLPGLECAQRSKGVRTTNQAKEGVHAGDLLNRDLTARRLDHTWVVDFTCSDKWPGLCDRNLKRPSTR